MRVLTEDPRIGREDWHGAVLLKDEIEYYSDSSNLPNGALPLIENFDRECLEPASYHLRLGKKYRINGEDKELSDNNPVLKIPPHGLVVVSTYEKINMPAFLIGRWNLKVKKVYEGLLWVGGPQVDPGFRGHLSCPLYNLSDTEIELRFKEPLFTIDFVRTTRPVPNPDPERGELWNGDPDRPLWKLDKNKLKSGIQKELSELDDKLKEFKGFQTLVFSIFAITIAALSFIGASKMLNTNQIMGANSHLYEFLGLSYIIAILSVIFLIAIFTIKSLFQKKFGFWIYIIVMGAINLICAIFNCIFLITHW